MKELVELICDNCGKRFKRSKSRFNRKDTAKRFFYCSKKCVSPFKNQKLPKEILEKREPAKTGEEHHSWKGGRYINDQGYVMVHLPNNPHSYSNGWALEHRVIASKKLGRKLKTSEQVHHIDGNKQNNSPNNLIILTCPQHTRLHSQNQNNRKENEENYLINCACGCGRKLNKYDNRGRPRMFIHGHK